MATMSAEDRHLPVLAQLCIDLLAPALQAENAILVDGTLGLGGHTELALTQLPNLTVIGIDRDLEALRLANDRLAKFGSRFIPVHSNYSEIAKVVADQGRSKVDGILLDLGVSSMQLDDEDRGFSYLNDAPLDMRMNQSFGDTAADVVNAYTREDLARIFSHFGEERFAYPIAARIVDQRSTKPFTTTGELVKLIQSVIPRKLQATGGHPAKRVFQALRIEVNAELSGLQKAIPAAIGSLRVGGRIAVEAYQSLEDRIVKQAFSAGIAPKQPDGLPFMLDEFAPYLKAITRGAIKADDSEIDRNPRAASVRLRAVEKLRENEIGGGR
jgi:16S rRNA (cytosine1402-N4)-methyltransferase